MNPGPWRREVDVALEAARESATLARDIRQRVGNRVWLKEDRSPVAVADFAVQALVADRLRQSSSALARIDPGLLARSGPL
jgi:3'-phosphoadenosine 5'-phosphosulfate (PAPS) 3'-phosphatase